MDILAERSQRNNKTIQYESTPDKTSPWSQTHMNRNTDKNYEVCLQITSRFGLAKVIVNVKRTRVLENISEILTVSSPFTLFHYVLNKIFYNGRAIIGYRCFGAFWSANNLPWPWLYTTDLASYLLTKWQFWQLTLKWLSRACAQDKTIVSRGTGYESRQSSKTDVFVSIFA